MVSMHEMAALGYVLLGGACAALYLVPTMSTPRWQWENIWGAGSLIALVLVPWPLAFATVPDLIGVYRACGMTPILLVVLFGVAWGAGGIFWGRSVAMLGMSLGLSILIGLVNIFGSPVPLAIKDPQRLFTRGGFWLLAAMIVLVVGVATCGLAGKRRNSERGGFELSSNALPHVSFAKAAVFCLLAGSLSAMNNFGPIFGGAVANAAVARGASTIGGLNAMWAPLFTANYLVNAGYALLLMKRRGTFGMLARNGSLGYWLQALFMGSAWPLCLVFYGIGIDKMGPYGAFTGYPLFLGSMIVTGNLAGIIRGEWSKTSNSTRLTLAIGILILGVAFTMLGLANGRLGVS